MEGRQLADTLSAEGIPCTYVLLTAISYMMRVRTSFDRFSLAIRDATMCVHIVASLRELLLIIRFNPVMETAGGDEGFYRRVGDDVQRNGFV